MDNKINSVAVLGSGTMGAGIAALAADKKKLCFYACGSDCSINNTTSYIFT